VPTVLIADGDATTRKLIEGAIKKCGVQVIVAQNGQEALEGIQANLPSLAILDVSMPFVSGLEVARELRLSPATAKIPIIFLTSQTQEQDVLDGFLSGAADYVFKPFSPPELQARVQAVLDRL
jgi:DNA-binding response OmpR family regulator